MPKEFLAVIGATASGKSALALRLASRLGGEIVSCDSMQIYRGMDVGTAKPTTDEMRSVPHHMIDVADPGEDFSAGDYAERASRAIDDIISRGKMPIVCGGTFLYLDSLTEIASLSEASKDKALREKLQKFAEEHGAGALHEKLREVDPESALAIHENNVKRVIRAIEIYETTGKPKSEWDRLSKEVEPPYRARRLMIAYHDRAVLYRRIDERVDAMMEQGLEEEARALYVKGYLSPERIASQAIGYKEFIDFFEGRATMSDVAATIKQSSRNYAKRQLTWLRRYDDVMTVWGDGEDGAPRTLDEIYEDSEALLRENGMI